MSGEMVAGRDGDGGSEIRLERKVETAGGGRGTCGERKGVQEVDLKVGSGCGGGRIGVEMEEVTVEVEEVTVEVEDTGVDQVGQRCRRWGQRWKQKRWRWE